MVSLMASMLEEKSDLEKVRWHGQILIQIVQRLSLMAYSSFVRV